MYRVKQQTTGSYTFTETPVDDDGVAVTPTGPFTAKVYDGAGVLITSPTATFTGGKFTASVAYTLLPKLDTYTIVWSGTLSGVITEWTSVVELCGGYLFEIAELRAQDRAFADTVKFPTADLRKVRNWVEDVIEGSRAAQVAFVPRGTRVSLDGTSPDFTRGYSPLLYGNDYRQLIAPNFNIRTLYSASINGTALTQTEIGDIAVADNVLWRSAGVHWPAWSFGKNNVSLHYSHGYDRPPGAITRAALILAREYLIKSDLPGRATATSIGDQIFRLTIAGRDGVTGIPDVDAAIEQFGRKGYAVG